MEESKRHYIFNVASPAAIVIAVVIHVVAIFMVGGFSGDADKNAASAGEESAPPAVTDTEKKDGPSKNEEATEKEKPVKKVEEVEKPKPAPPEKKIVEKKPEVKQVRKTPSKAKPAVKPRKRTEKTSRDIKPGSFKKGVLKRGK